MALAKGSRLGPYEIIGPLGAGGMGEVYRANDTKLKRQVAIKILPSDLAADPARLARFQREAEVLASLNHPHIGAIYGFEESSGVNGLVMELVEGPTLADRIAQGPIPLDEALPIARQIADALEAAHERGIVHRDLKPANIKVRDDGTVKVLDFGLAKAGSTGSTSSTGSTGSETFADSPTMASPAMSMAGMILGTAAYMSPEQARGKSVDKRSDVWAFGAVLYEMLTGKRAFEGDEITDIIANVVKSTPDWSALPSTTPAHIVTLIKRCLEKDQKARIGDIAVARFLLSSDSMIATATAMASPTETSAASRSWWPLAFAVAALAAIGMAAWIVAGGRNTNSSSVAYLDMSVSPAEFLMPSLNSGVRPSRLAFAIMPDGRRIIFAGGKAGAFQLYSRELGEPEAAAIAGTEGASAPFVAPDGQWIAFVAAGKIQRVPASGGPPTTICELPVGPTQWGATWGEDGNIYFASRTGIFKVRSGGGTAEQVTTADVSKGDRHLLPQLLPDGKTLIYTAPPDVVVRSLDTGKEEKLIEGAADARFVAPDRLLFMKNGVLMGAPFNANTHKLTGPPAALVENVMQGVNAGNGNDETLAGQFVVSKSGTLVYASGGINPPRQDLLVWVDRNGTSQVLAGPKPFLHPRVSPDGTKVAVSIRADNSREADLWVYDVERATPTRLTFDGSGASAWSPDSKRLAVAVGNGISLINADGSGKPEQLSQAEFQQIPAAWPPALNAIVYLQRPTANSFGLWLLPMQGSRKPELIHESKFPLTFAAFSPDGKWAAYASNESGGYEVYVQAYPGGGNKTRISLDGGNETLWLGNGKELLFRSGQGDQQFVSAAVKTTNPLRFEKTRVVFTGKPGEYDATTPSRSWDATSDGRKFLLTKNAESSDKLVTSLHVVMNWMEELRQKTK